MQKPLTHSATIDSRRRPWRILFVIDSLEGDGAERQLCELVKGIAETPDFEPYVVVLEPSIDGHAWMLEDIGIEISLVARKSRFSLAPILEICRLIRTKKIDLVHTYMTMGGEFGLAAAKLSRLPVITSSIRNAKNRDWKEFIRTNYQSRLADIAVANSQSGLENRFRSIRSSFRVINNGMDFSRFNVCEEKKNKLRAELKLSYDDNLICMAARMEAQKDHLTLIKAMKQVVDKHANTVLLLAGDGSNRQGLLEMCKNFEIQNNVRFLGHRRDVESIISICGVSILLTNTNIHLEGISNTVVESMALGAAVIATGGGGTDEILSDKLDRTAPYEMGIKVDPFSVEQVFDGIDYLISNPNARVRISECAAAMAKRRFGLTRFIEENVSLYRELLI